MRVGDLFADLTVPGLDFTVVSPRVEGGCPPRIVLPKFVGVLAREGGAPRTVPLRVVDSPLSGTLVVVVFVVAFGAFAGIDGVFDRGGAAFACASTPSHWRSRSCWSRARASVGRLG